MTDHGGLTNDLADWFPLVEATGAPVPATTIIPIPASLVESFFDGPAAPPEADTAMAAIIAAVESYGVPAFMRTGEVSGKHSWKYTCFVDTLAEVPYHVNGVLHEHLMAFGLAFPKTIIVREMLKTTPAFHAFHGTPITAERRYFIRDGKVYDHHPYWPAMAIEGHVRDDDDVEAATESWLPALKAISEEPADQVALLTELTERAGATLEGAWSMDWLLTQDRGWVFIDAAHAESSYTMPEEDRAALLT